MAAHQYSGHYDGIPPRVYRHGPDPRSQQNPGLSSLTEVFDLLIKAPPVIVAVIATKQVSELDEVSIVAGIVAGVLSIEGALSEASLAELAQVSSSITYSVSAWSGVSPQPRSTLLQAVYRG